MRYVDGKRYISVVFSGRLKKVKRKKKKIGTFHVSLLTAEKLKIGTLYDVCGCSSCDVVVIVDNDGMSWFRFAY